MSAGASNPVPVFVVGRNRSGTKWLTNVLATHPQVVAVQAEVHGGALEENVFVHVQRVFGDWRVSDNFRAFCAFYERTDFFRLTGLSPTVLDPERPRPYLDAFEEVMHAFALRRAATHWVQKASVAALADLYDHFPEGRFLLLSRRPIETIRSSVAMRRQRGARPRAQVFREAAGWGLDRKRLLAFARRDRCLAVDYDALRSNRDSTLARVWHFLSLDSLPGPVSSRFSPNSSFATEDDRRGALTKLESWTAVATLALCRVVPRALLEMGQSLVRPLTEGVDGRRFTPGTFRLPVESVHSEPEGAFPDESRVGSGTPRG